MRSLLLDALWFLFWAIASSVWCLSASRQLGATFDEPIYIARGLEGWRAGSHAGLLHLGTMPLPVDVQTLPLFLWERWRGVPFDAAADLERLLPVARAATLIFWWLLLFYGWRFGRLLAGPWAGRLTVALLACEPNLLAHASLATTDLAVSACVLGLIYHFRVGREATWPRRVAVPAFWFAAAVLAKASGLAFGLLCLAAVEWERAGPRNLWRDLTPIVGGGLILVFLYCGCDGRPEPSLVAWARRQPDGRRDPAVWLAEHLCIFSNAGEGLARQIKHNLHGHGVYLLGRTDDRAIWYYFPVVLSIKLSLSLLLGLAALLLLRPRALVNGPCLAAAALLLFSLTCRVQLGVRLVLPLVVLLIVGLATALVQSGQALGPRRRGFVLAGTAIGLLGAVLAALRVWPHGLCHVNELWGGTADGYVHVSETNYDWGQGLPELERWRQARAVPTLDVWYFGTDPHFARLPLRSVPLHALPIERSEDVAAQVQGRYLAVSTTLLYGMATDTEANRRAVAFLRRLQPAARTTTFLIFDFADLRTIP